MTPRYRVVLDLAVRLIQGERIELTDADGRRWRATAEALAMALPHATEFDCVASRSAFEVAARLASLLPDAANRDDDRDVPPATRDTGRETPPQSSSGPSLRTRRLGSCPMPVVNVGGPPPSPPLWWAFYVPAALLAAIGAGFEYCGRAYGATSTTRACEMGLFAFALAWLIGAIRSTVRQFSGKGRANH